MEVALQPLRAMLARKCGRSRPCLGTFLLDIDWGAKRKLSKLVDAAARKTGTYTKSHTFCASFRIVSYFRIAIKIIHSQEGYHPHPTASGILKMPTNGGYLVNAPILGSGIRAQIELFEKLYEAFKAGYLKSVQNHTKTAENCEKRCKNS